MTKAVILSGGWGTRLRPLTCTIPKTLIPIVNVPLMENTIKQLIKAGIKEIILAVSVMSDQLENYFGDGSKWGISIYYTEEKEPMGTAGAVKLAENLIGTDNFFMLNGDVISYFDFSQMLKAHKNYGGLGTISSYTVEDPRRYGTLVIDNNSRIIKFLEKKIIDDTISEIKPMPINAGIYVLENEVLSYIESDRPVSIERKVFPVLAKEDNLYAYEISGIWKDIGLPEDYFYGNFMILENLFQEKGKDQKKLISEGCKIGKNVEIIPPVALDQNVIIENNSRIGPNVIVGKYSKICDNCEISNSILFDHCYISKGVKMNNTIIADYCSIGEKTKIEGSGNNLVILSSWVSVKDNLDLKGKTTSIRVCHHELVKESILE